MLENVKGLLALPDDPAQRAAAKQGLLAAGAAMMASQGHNFLGSAGQGLLAGGNGYQEALQQQQQAAYRQAQQQRWELENQQTQAALARPGKLADIWKRNPRPDPAILKSSQLRAAAAETPPNNPAGSNLTPEGYQPRTIDQLPHLDQAQPGQQTLPNTLPPAQLEAFYRQKAYDYWEAGEAELADKFMGYADNQKRKLMKRETLLDKDKKPVSVLTYENGEEATSAYGALPDNQVVDMGDRQEIVDRNIPRDGKKFQMGVSPNAAVTANATREVAAATREAARTQRDQATEMKLADDYRGQSKGFKDVSDAYQQISAVLPSASQSPAATLAGATKFMKLLDPGSVVRESELGMALAATGVFDRATNYIETLKHGKVLTPAQVKDFQSITQKVYQAAQQGQRMVDGNYRNQAKTYGLRPEMIVQDLGQNTKTTGPVVPIPLGAIEKLRANPGLRSQFEAKYGAGSADSVLGE